MDFENYAPARDFFYLAALFCGAGAGCFLNVFRIRAAARFRSHSVTAGFLFAAVSLAAFFASVILSGWAVLRESGLYIPSCVFAALALLVFRFPKAAGFPVFLAASVFAVWTGYVCLRYPVIDGSALLRVSCDGNSIGFSAPGGDAPPVFAPDRGADGGTFLEATAFLCSFVKTFPLARGESRGVVAEVRRGGEVLYRDSRPEKYYFPGRDSGGNAFLGKIGNMLFTFWETRGQLETEKLPPGAALSVYIEGNAIDFR